MFEDGLAHRESGVTGEALYCTMMDSEVQEETQGQSEAVQGADESIVVMKPRPMKPGNRVEDKTGVIHSIVFVGAVAAKSVQCCEGRKSV